MKKIKSYSAPRWSTLNRSSITDDLLGTKDAISTNNRRDCVGTKFNSSLGIQTNRLIDTSPRTQHFYNSTVSEVEVAAL